MINEQLFAIIKLGDKDMKIKKMKKLNSGKYKIEFENGEHLSTYDDVILKNQLLFHKEVDSKEMKTLMKDTDYFNVYNKMLKKISVKLRSEAEIKKELGKEHISEQEATSILKKLKENGFINDLNFAKAYVNDKVYLSNEGPYKIRKGLEENSIKEEWIEEAMSLIDSKQIEEKLQKIIMKKIKLNHKHSNYMLKQKLLMELSMNGFSKEMISEIFDACASENNVLEKEVTRVYYKLSKKYQGLELNKKLKEKLYQKGFSITEIDTILKEKGL